MSSSLRWLLIASAVALTVPWFVGFQAADYVANQQRLTAMSPQELAELRRKKEMFDSISADEKARLREFDEQLHREPNATQLLKLLRVYSRWLKALDRETKQEVLGPTKVSDRIQVINRVLIRQRLRSVPEQTRLPEADVPAFIKWVQATLRKKYDKLREGDARLPKEFQANNRQIIHLFPALERENLFDDSDFAELAQRLSPAGVQILQSKENDKAKSRLVVQWWMATPFARIPPAELDQFLSGLMVEYLNYIEQLGPEQGRQELERRFWEEKRRNR